MKIFIGITIGIVATLMFGVFFESRIEVAKVLSANDYCRSQGYDYAMEQYVDKQYAKPYGVVETPRVKCGYQRTDENGKPNNGFAWLGYPPKTDLENYCYGNLTKSATVIIPK